MEVVKSYIANARHAVLKIVMGKRDLLSPSEIRNFLEKLKSNTPVYIMPLCTQKNELEELSPDIWAFALEHGYRVSDRLHIRVFNGKKCV
jgi:organic radical activating enzyme